MAKNYQRHATGGSFKRQDFGDLGLRSFRDQQNVINEALRLQQARAKEYGDDYATALKGAGRSEEENKRILNELENKAYETRRRALNVRADREVAYIKSQADEAGRKKDYWQDFSTTYAQQWGKLAQGLVGYADYRFAKKLQEDDDFQSKLDEKYISPHTIQDEGYKIVGDGLSKNAAIEQDPYFAKKIVEKHLSRSDIHGKNISKKFEDNLDLIEETFHKVGGDRLTQTNTEELSEDYINNFLIDSNVHPNSTAGKKIRARWRTRVVTGLSEDWDKKEFERDQEVTMRLIKDIDADPSTENVHKLVEHLRSAHYRDEDGKIHSTTTKRNPAETWIIAAAYQLEYGDKKLTWMNSVEQFQNIFFDHPILRNNKGEISKEIFSEKAQQRISQFLPKLAKIIDDNTKAEAVVVKNKKEIEPLAKMENEIREMGHEATLGDWGEGGWILKNEQWFRENGSPEALSKFYDRIKFNPTKHKDIEVFAQYSDSLEDTSIQGIQRTLHLLEYIEDNYGGEVAGNYADLKGVRKNITAYVNAGVFTNPIYSKWAEKLVRVGLRENSLNKTVDGNGLRAIQQLEFYRAKIFNSLNPDDFKNDQARLDKAQEITEQAFNDGIEKKTGYFAAEDITGTGIMKLRWNFGQASGDDHVFNSFDYLQRLEDAGNNWAEFEKADVINQNQASGIVSDILQGSWDGKIPENVKTYASLRGLDPREALDSILTNMGFKIKTPVTSQDQFLQSLDDRNALSYHRFGVSLNNIKRSINTKHNSSMMLWGAFVEQNLRDNNAWVPVSGPQTNPNFKTYVEQNERARALLDLDVQLRTSEKHVDRQIKQNEKYLNNPVYQDILKNRRRNK